MCLSVLSLSRISLLYILFEAIAFSYRLVLYNAVCVPRSPSFLVRVTLFYGGLWF